jgi:hypothetical protein
LEGVVDMDSIPSPVIKLVIPMIVEEKEQQVPATKEMEVEMWEET